MELLAAWLIISFLTFGHLKPLIALEGKSTSKPGGFSFIEKKI